MSAAAGRRARPPPVLVHQASMAAAICYGVHGGGAQLAFQITPGNDDTDRLIEVLGELRRFLGGEKATLLWDGLPAHRSNAMSSFGATTCLTRGCHRGVPLRNTGSGEQRSRRER